MSSPCDITTTAQGVLDDFTSNLNFAIPDLDFSKEIYNPPNGLTLATRVEPLTNASLASGAAGGTGTFDVLMRSVSSHLEAEIKGGRISQADASKVYLAAMQTAMTTAVQFLVQRDQAYWLAQKAQADTITAFVDLEATKVKAASMRFDAYTAKANYGLAMTRIGTESITYCSGRYTYDELLPLQKTKSELDNSISSFQLSSVLPKNASMLDHQITGQIKANNAADFTFNYIMPNQRDLLKEQYESQRAQTLDNRSDGQVVAGMIGKQKNLHQQQTDAYRRDSENKVAKLILDGWMTSYTVSDGGNTLPSHMTDAGVTGILTQLVTNVGMSN